MSSEFRSESETPYDKAIRLLQNAENAHSLLEVDNLLRKVNWYLLFIADIHEIAEIEQWMQKILQADSGSDTGDWPTSGRPVK